MPYNLVFSFRCVVASRALVGQKTSDLNDAELPHLEINVTLNHHTCHALYGRCTRIRWASAARPLLYYPLPAASIPLWPHPAPFLVVFDCVWSNMEKMDFKGA